MRFGGLQIFLQKILEGLEFFRYHDCYHNDTNKKVEEK